MYPIAKDVIGLIRIEHLGKRGVYLWTNKINHKQYIGSSINISNRLSSYFATSYLKNQSERGSAICLAILKYGLENFSIEVIELGISPAREDVKVTDDFIAIP